MKYRQLGSTGISVSEVGFGGWGIGGAPEGAVSYGPTDDGESRRALARAFELGVTFFDTSDLYGFGHSERLIGETLRSVRAKIVIATKAGFLGPDGPQDFSADYIRSALKRSLTRLQTDYIDLFQLHNPPLERLNPNDALMRMLQDMKRTGMIRAVGVSLRSPADGAAAAGAGVDVVQVNFNMIDQRARECGLLEACRVQRVGVIARTPLCFGFLSGVYSASDTFDRQDHRSRWPQEQIARWAEAPRMFTRVTRLTPETPAQLALRYCLSYPATSTVIPGMLGEAHVEENTAASDMGELAPEVRQAIEAVYQQSEFFVRSVSTASGSN